LNYIVFSRSSDRLERFSDGRFQDWAPAVNEDICRPYLDGVVNFRGIKVLRSSLARSPYSCPMLIPLLDWFNLLVQADGRVQKSIPSYPSFKSRAAVLEAGRFRKSLTPFPVFWSLAVGIGMQELSFTKNI
jgi:hypothetical protein